MYIIIQIGLNLALEIRICFQRQNLLSTVHKGRFFSEMAVQSIMQFATVVHVRRTSYTHHCLEMFVSTSSSSYTSSSSEELQPVCSFFPKKNLLREIQALFSNLHRWREDTNHQRLVYLQRKSSKRSFTLEQCA